MKTNARTGIIIWCYSLNKSERNRGEEKERTRETCIEVLLNAKRKHCESKCSATSCSENNEKEIAYRSIYHCLSLTNTRFVYDSHIHTYLHKNRSISLHTHTDTQIWHGAFKLKHIHS